MKNQTSASKSLRRYLYLMSDFTGTEHYSLKICSRIIMTPEHAKRLLSALSDNVEKYESQFGAIDFKQAKPSGTLNITDLMGGNGSRS